MRSKTERRLEHVADKRLIEVAFPLKQASLDSVHEKNVRHGHISTLHIWPARRPLAASRAALIATLLPDPGDTEMRKALLERMAGRVVEQIERKRLNGRVVEKVKEVTEGGILHWGRENGPDLDWFRDEIRKAYGGRAPKFLDPFAGGGAIPLEAMRLGCDVTAMDINPVAWFILKCTLEYPQKLAGQTRPLPFFALKDRDFMEAFLNAKGYKGARLQTQLGRLGHRNGAIQLDALPESEPAAGYVDPVVEADLAWHVRACGRWVLARARRELAAYYPTYAEFEPLNPGSDFEPLPARLLDTDDDGVPLLDALNGGFDAGYLRDPRNPRWVAKPTVAYLWARTVRCKQCRATLPLLKTRWLCKKDKKRVLLTMESDAGGRGVAFEVQADVPRSGGNSAQRREHDRRIGAGTMSRTGAACPSCKSIMTMEDIRYEGCAGRLGAVMTAVVVDGQKGKEYRLPTNHERAMGEVSEEQLQALYADIPFGLPEEPLPSKDALGFRVPLYGFDTWRKLFTNRQLAYYAALIKAIRGIAAQTLQDDVLTQCIVGYLLCVFGKQLDYCNGLCSWYTQNEQITHLFNRFAIPIKWDFAETSPLGGASGSWESMLKSVTRSIDTAVAVDNLTIPPTVSCNSAIGVSGRFDVIVTDPPYYDAIPYSDCMDFFHVWLKRSSHGLFPEMDAAFRGVLGPKWDHDTDDGELIDDKGRFDGNRERSKKNYEEGMARAFYACHAALNNDGRLVVVFANKHPDAWETLVAALIRAGFVVDGSWPVQTEMSNRTRSLGSAALSSSVWLVCKKRGPTRPGWDAAVLSEMRENITQQLRDFWDAGIRGPDFVWAATGPALEAFSKHPIVKKANDPDQIMTVSEFLREVRRMVVDFVVGRVLTHNGGQEAVSGLDDVTTYYLLHRNDFGMEDAPVGACILYALSCNLSDSALAGQHDLLTQPGKRSTADEGQGQAEGSEDTEGSGAKLKLKTWNRRSGRNLGLEGTGGLPAPLIDQVHKLMQLWRAGDQSRVDEYLDTRGLQRNALFNQILQALIELADADSDERSILEAISNHVASRGDVRAPRQQRLLLGDTP